MHASKKIKLFCLLYSISFFAINCNAQDSLAKKDSTNNYYAFNTKTPVPKRAAMYSALFPGLGQAYNKQFWKLPIVYAGVGISAYLFTTTNNDYQIHRQAFIARSDNNPNTLDTFTTYSLTDLRNLERSNRQTLDKIVVYSAAYYGLNIVDALVSAHLKNFDVSKTISMRLMPTLIDDKIAGIAIKFNWK